jgi:hypothetical protein
MFPERLVAALVACAAGSGLLVLERNAVAALGDQAGQIGLEEIDGDPDPHP